GQPFTWARTDMFPKYTGPFLRATRLDAPAVIEVLLGQWWLTADGAKERVPQAKTYNARWEDLARRQSFRGPWARGQRCIVPAEIFYEPNWETGRHVPWRFRPSDGSIWGLAGLWNEWTDPATGEVHASYTLLTQNADHHPLMKRMHKPDPMLPPDAQDKRSVVPIPAADTATWLFGSAAEAATVVRLAPAHWFDAGPDAPAPDLQGSLL
ncbi:MAG: SOS response-associated peptidase, partial [Pseudomonadota bacterium]|nr:SOS response-associated peptidase [Pseudomonadota bacterium]